MPTNSKRLFIAINLLQHVRQELAAVSKFSQHPLIRWTPQENLHVTLHFIGQTELNAIDPIKEKISVIASKTPSFSMAIEKLKVVRKNRTPAMIWASLEENEIFTALALQLQSELPGDNSKKPNPHITLARIKNGRGLDLPVLPQIFKIHFDVRNIELMESITSQSGPVYKVVESFNLEGIG
jgi:2'-5' RNA ligase